MKKALLLAAPALLALAACNADQTGGADAGQGADADTAQVDGSDGADSMASNDPAEGEEAQVAIPDSEERPMMQKQVVLDRLGFTPGVVDGKMGMSTENAIKGFQEANDLEITGKLDEKTETALAEWDRIPATRVVTIPASFAGDGFEAIPEDPAEKAKMERLGYTSLDEKLAERFHTTVETLKMLNPNGKPAGWTEANAGSGDGGATMKKAAATEDASGSPYRPLPEEDRADTASAKSDKQADKNNGESKDASDKKADSDKAKAPKSYFAAGQQIRVPNIGADKIAPGSVEDNDWLSTLRMLGVGTEQPKAARVVVDESDGTLKAFDADDKLIAMFTATMGSEHDPLPLGDWKIQGVAHNPPFAYNPELFWDVPDDQEKQMMPPGPNGPVGVVWIDLSKEHYGIHGTPEPQTIGRVQSHGCIRLTNWDAARLAQMVSTSTKAVFQA